MAHHVCYECLGVVQEDWDNCTVCGRTRPDSGWGLDPLEGLVLADRYRLAHRLGEGGMGTVYRAERVGTLGGFVAVKILSPHLSKTVLAKRFEREARSLSKLSSPHIVRVYDFDTFAYPVDGQPLYFIAMEVVEGTPLSSVLKDKQGKVPFAWALDVLRQTARGLDEAHELGIVHRDLKPSNLMIIQQRRSSHVKILDFGIAAITEEPGEEVEKLTRTGLVTGTPDYMAPEQAMGKEIGPAADMYSLGIIAYQMFTGVLPFAGPTAMAKLTKRLTEDPPPLREQVPPPALPDGIYDIVDRLLAREPENRFKDAAELLDALAPFHTGETTPEMAASGGGGGGGEILTPYEGSPIVDQSMRTEIVNDKAGRKVKPARGGEDGAKKGGKGLIIALVVLLLGGGGTAAWYFTAGPGGSSGKAAATADAGDKAKKGDKKNKGDKKKKADKKKADKKKADKKKADKKKAGDKKKGPAWELGKARPPLDDAWRPPVTTFLPGALTLKIAMPKEKVPLYKPLELRLAVDHGPTALVLGSAKVWVSWQDPTRGSVEVGTASGKANKSDGRVAVSLPPLPTPVDYILDVEYSIPGKLDGRVKLIYDAAASALKTP